MSDCSTHAELVEMTQENYNLDMNREVMDLIYLLPDEMMQQMAPDIPPIHVTNDRQVRNLIAISKAHVVHFCLSSRGKTRIVGDANINGNQDGEDVDEVSDEEEEEEEDYEDVNEVKNEGEEDANFSDTAEVDDEFADYSVYGKFKDEDDDEEEADDISF